MLFFHFFAAIVLAGGLISAANLPAGFSEALIPADSTPLSRATAMAFAPDGRLFVCEQGGKLRVVKNGRLLSTPFLTVPVDSDGERGLLGVAFDPNFSSNNYVYVYYTATTTPRHNQVSRFTANGDEALPGSEQTILTLNDLSGATNHNGGAIHFGPDGKLYIAVGENANRANSQNLTNLLGKILRINADGTIPQGNPFANQTSGINQAIWAIGLRNPFTFAFQPGTGRMFINDVGENTWEEINDGIAGSNYGWPAWEATTNQLGYDNPNTAPLYAYDHSGNARSIAGGAFYNPPAATFPASYVGKYFFADYCADWIRVLDPVNGQATGFATGISFPVDLKIGPDASLYYLTRGAVYRVSYAPTDVQVTVQTSPPGLAFQVDGVTYTGQQIFAWAPATVHTVAAISPQGSGGTRQVFSSWSDSGAQAHGVTTPANPVTLTAYFNTQYLLSASIAGGSGSVQANPASADGFYNAGTTVSLTATPAAGYVFSGWSGDISGASNPAELNMNAPRSVAASFAPAPVCGYLLSSNSTTVAATGDLRKVNVSAASECAWQAASNAGWVTVVSGASGAGNGSVRFRVEANTSSTPRGATLTIGGVPFTITQAAGGCVFSLTGNDFTLVAAGGSHQLAITASGATCQWSATATPSWIALTTSTAGLGSGTLGFSVPPNIGSVPRSGYIVVGGQWWQVVQKALSAEPVFTDVPLSHLFFDSITLLKLDGISAGCGGTQYCPEAPMTRSEMAAFLIRALYGETFTFPGTPYFSDVGTGHPYFRYIQKLREIGVTNGCTTTAYCPDDTVTRGQMAAFIVRARLGVTYAETFPFLTAPLFDDVVTGNVFFNYIQKLKELGITSGCTPAAYCPNDLNTRGQMAVFLVRGLLTP
ncbi:MAG: PQQ-dependent sugar dehydrogenase [Bryobacterales bacterium]|nr:PQQ-dependent sugar dehydrogenase [Bryobacterales bacterium]